MILSDVDIKEAIGAGKILIEPPPDEDQYSSSSLDLRLGNEFKTWNESLVHDAGVQPHVTFSNVQFQKLAPYLEELPRTADGKVVLKPGKFILAKTYEKITLKRESKLAARIEGRSTAARLGFTVHLSAPTIHAGWSGNITLEIVNLGPFHIALEPNRDRVCQLIFEQVASLPSKENPSAFQEQVSVTGDRAPEG